MTMRGLNFSPFILRLLFIYLLRWVIKSLPIVLNQSPCSIQALQYSIEETCVTQVLKSEHHTWSVAQLLNNRMCYGCLIILFDYCLRSSWLNLLVQQLSHEVDEALYFSLLHLVALLLLHHTLQVVITIVAPYHLTTRRGHDLVSTALVVLQCALVAATAAAAQVSTLHA
jgi:hypothetical protein